MTLSFERIAILGATGPTGRHMAAELTERGERIRVISRRQEALEALFPGDAWERRSADALDPDSLVKGVEGCDLVVDCIGLPGDQMDRHPDVARTLAQAVRRTGARCLQISSYWSYIPIGRLPVSEQSPREGGPPWVRYRREAEDVLADAGAAIVQLPDFFGPHVHTSTLQLALKDAIAGRPMNWIGGAQVERDYIYVPDAMGLAAELAHRPEAYGERWLIPGSGPISAAQIARTVSQILGREVKLRTAGPLLLRLLSLFKPELRGMLQMVPTYVRPIRFDGGRLERLLGDRKRTSYETALRVTLEAET